MYPVQAKVRGVVKDSAGEPLPGANVAWVNTKIFTVTAEDGSFSVDKPKDSETLVISYIGFENDTIHVDSENVKLEIVLREGLSLGEVNVVRRRFGTTKLRSSAMNVDIISSAELSRAAIWVKVL